MSLDAILNELVKDSQSPKQLLQQYKAEGK